MRNKRNKIKYQKELNQMKYNILNNNKKKLFKILI